MAATKELELSSKGASELSENGSGRSWNVAILAAKYLLWLLCWGITAFYAMVWIILPTKNGGKLFLMAWYEFETNKQWAGPGVYILMFSGPFIVLAVVACLYLELEKAYPSRRKAPKHRNGWLRRVWDSLWTQPLVVRGPLGMMSTIEVLGLAMVIFVTLWHFCDYTIEYFKEIDAAIPEEGSENDPHMSIRMQKFDIVAVMIGWVAMIPMALLFVPVTRGSSILQLIDIPYEHAVKYHTWLGHLTLLLTVVHSVAYGIYYAELDEFHLFFKWQKTGIANLPGVIGFVAGLLMWPTSLAYVRRRFFNVFFGIHQLYIVFVLGTVWHLGLLLSGYFYGAVFLFFIDRFMRFVQSRRAIQGVTATVLPTGIVQLKLPVSPGPSYTPLSFMFLNFRGLAKLEWHPFSVASTPLDNTRYMSILIKPLGDWTKKLKKSVEDSSGEGQAPAAAGCPFSLKLFAEGPYGHESNYYLHYKHVLLVAGGIGVTPFMAITQDILHRYQRGEEGLPTTLDLIWCVKNRSELLAFKDLFCDPARIFSGYGSNGSDFQVNVKVFLTAEKGATTADEVASELQASRFAPQALQYRAGYSHNYPGVDRAGSGTNLLMQAAVITAASLGLTLFLALFRVYIYLPHSDVVTYTKELLGWIDVLLFLVSTAVGVFVFGGAVMGGFWLASRNKGESKSAGGKGVQSIDLHHVQNAQDEKLGHLDIEESGLQQSLLQRAFITTGTRPNFNEVFNDIREQNGKSGADVAVLVCGPTAMAVTVAEQCRSQNFGNVWNNNYSTHFHYHSVTFDL